MVVIAALVILSGQSLALADSDGTVAFGKNFVVFTRFGPHRQTLNVVPLKEHGSLEVAASIDVPISYSTIAVRGQRIFVLWWKSLFVYELKSNWTPELLKTIEVPDAPTVRSLSVAGNDLVIRNDTGDLHIDLTKPISEWRLAPLDRNTKPEPSEWVINKQGDWVPANGACLVQPDGLTCLVYGTSGSEGIQFTDKLLVKRSMSGGTIQTTLYIGTGVETFD